jgi:hypothetical protein
MKNPDHQKNNNFTDHKMEKENKRENLDAVTTERKGIGGLLELFLRKFRLVSFIIALLPLYFISFLAMGIAAAPGIWFFDLLSGISLEWHAVLHYMAMGCGIVFGYLIYGISLLFVLPIFNFLLPFRLKPFRGSYFSLSTVPWYFHNALTYVARYTFLEFVTPTPLNTLFYKMMGMKIGKGSQINTTNISDPCLIEIGEKVTIGGSATLIAHYASQGYLVVDRLKIGNKATVGLKATIFGDVDIGEGAIVAPHEVILPKSRIPEGRR